MSENRVIRGIFGFKWDEVTAECRKRCNVENHDLHPATYIIGLTMTRRTEHARHVMSMQEWSAA
jgi:hypothetical protein